jgi:rubrerythrin
MKKEEACRRIDNIDYYLQHHTDDYSERDHEAMMMSKKALEQEPRKGHWDIKDNMWWVCSACGCQTRMMKKYNVPRFCPACGAKMVEPQESEET